MPFYSLCRDRRTGTVRGVGGGCLRPSRWAGGRDSTGLVKALHLVIKPSPEGKGKGRSSAYGTARWVSSLRRHSRGRGDRQKELLSCWPDFTTHSGSW